MLYSKLLFVEKHRRLYGRKFRFYGDTPQMNILNMVIPILMQF